ncbi:hypothetical protein Plhal304r1_c002g0005511 [Plasmopara halstedii]
MSVIVCKISPQLQNYVPPHDLQTLSLLPVAKGVSMPATNITTTFRSQTNGLMSLAITWVDAGSSRLSQTQYQCHNRPIYHKLLLGPQRNRHTLKLVK